MIEDNLCHQFISGFCTKQNFGSQITEKCRKLHDSGKKNAYDMDIIHENDLRVFKEYDNILWEIDQKIENNKKIIRLGTKFFITKENIKNSTITPDDPKKENNEVTNQTKVEFKLKEIRDLLFQINEDFTHALKTNLEIDKLLIFHQYYARCLDAQNKCDQSITLEVCDICSHVYENKCEHPFHDQYVELRKITDQMKTKLKIKKF